MHPEFEPDPVRQRRRASDRDAKAGGAPPARPSIGVGDVEEFFRKLSAAESALDTLSGGELDAVLEPSTAVPVLLSRAQEAVVRSEARHRDLVERCPALVVELAPDGTLLFANEAARRVVGHRAEDVVGTRWWRAMVPDDWHDEAIAMETVIAHGDVTARMLPLATRGGEVRWVEWTSASRFHPDGTLATAILFGLDVTERRRADAAARRLTDERLARVAAEAANRAKSEFLAMMSHELRTPLNAIAGHVQLLEMGVRGPVTDAQKEALGRVQSAQLRLLGLVNDVLNYTKLDAGKVEFEVTEVDVTAAIGGVVALLEGQLEAKGLRLTVEPLPPVLVWADQDKLEQILLNLLSNAIKFTPARQADGSPGHVTLKLEDAADPEVVSLTVRDTGIGIAPERQAAVFEPFVQLNVGLTRRHEGTGLGLAISRDLARGMGGEVTVESVEGVGSTFTLTLRRVVSATGERTDRRMHTDRRVVTERRTADDRRGASGR